MTNRILVAIDESEASTRVAGFVDDLFGGRDDVEIIALHVLPAPAPLPPAPLGGAQGVWWTYPTPAAGPSTGFLVGNSPIDDATGADPDVAEERGEEVVRQSGLDADRVEAEVGDVTGAIRHVADREDARLIVVGSNNKGWFERLITGSVSRDLARESERPVLIV